MARFKPTCFMAEASKYNKKAADYAVSFIECLSHTKGTWAGKKFELLDWQEQIIRDLFGILKPNGYRQFNTAYIEIPKKMANQNLPLRLPCCSPVVMAKNVPKSTAVLPTANRLPLYLMWRRIWCECVLPFPSE